MARPIVIGFDSRVERGGYRSKLILDKNANPKDVESLVEALKDSGLKVVPAYYNTQDILSYSEQHGAAIGEPYETIALSLSLPDGKHLEGSIDGPSHIDKTLEHKLSEAGFLNKELITLSQKASAWVKPEANAAKRAMQDLLAKGTPQEKYKKVMAFYALGDVSGVATGALINKEIGDAGYAGLAGLATALGYAGNELEEAKTLAEKLYERASSPSSWEPNVAYTNGPSRELRNPADAAKGAVRNYGKDVFNIVNFFSFFPLLQAGLSQDKSAPKIIASIMGMVQWAIISFVPKKGQKGLIDAEDFTESVGIKQKLDEARSQGNSSAIKLLDTIRNDPNKFAGNLGVIRNLAMMGVTVWDWTVSPSRMRSIERKYAVKDGPTEQKGFWKTLKDTSSKLFGGGTKHSAPVADSERFHKKSAEGNVEKYWWQMDDGELAAHIENLKIQASIEPKKFDEFLKDVKDYKQKQRLVKGGLGNLIMIASYALANTILGESSSSEKVNLPELYSLIAIDALAIKDGHERSAFVMNKAKLLSIEPEIRENPVFEGLNEETRASLIYSNILKTAGRMPEDTRLSHMFKKGSGAEPAAAFANLTKEGSAQVHKALQIPAHILNFGSKTKVSAVIS